MGNSQNEETRVTNGAKRIAVVTGTSSGIGKETAKALAARGWHVIGVGRDPERTAAARAEIAAFATGRVDMLRGDLSLFAEAQRIAGEIAGLTDRIHVLVNNAGGMAKEKVVTAEGNEQNFASNHLGPFLLTQRLLPLLHAATAGEPEGAARILMTASDASEMIPGFDWDDLQGLERFNPGASYCRCKLANVMFTRGLAKRLRKKGIVAHVMHPGLTDTNFINHADPQAQATMRARFDQAKTAAEAADTLIWLATAEEPGTTTGGYWDDRKSRTPNPLADDDAAVERLWAESERIVAAAGF